MLIRYHDHGQPDAALCTIVEHRAASLEKIADRLDDEFASLDVTILYDIRCDVYTTRLTLQLAGQRVEAIGDALLRAQSIDRAFRLLARQVETTIEQGSREHVLTH